jgi:hypothetical protein
MNINNSLIIKKNNLKVFVATFLIVIGSGSIADIFLTQLLILFSFGVLLLIYVSYNFANYKLFIKALAVIFFFLLFSFLVSPYKEIGNYITLFMRSISALLFIFIISLNGTQLLIKALRITLILLLIYGLINYFIYPFVQLKLFSIENEYQHYNTFKYLFYYGERFTEEYDFFGIKMTRNAGFFWEPGVNQFFLNMLLFIELNLLKRTNKTIIVITIFSILSTYSTIGILILGIQLFLYGQKKGLFSKKVKVIISLLSGIILYFSIFFIIPQKLEMGSFAVRALDLFQSIEILMDNLLFGIGINGNYFTEIRGNYGVNFEFINAINDIDKGNSNSILSLLISFGLPLGGFVLISLFRQKLFQNGKLIFSFILFFSLMTEPLVFKPLFLAFIISAGVLSQKKINKYLD